MDLLDMFKGYRELKQKLSAYEDNIRPVFAEHAPGGSTQLNGLTLYPYVARELKWMALQSDILRLVIQHLKNEIFRNGIEPEPNFVSKCTNPSCGKEYDYMRKTCEECNNMTGKPDYNQAKILKQKLENPINNNNQTLRDVLEQVQDDLEILDNGFLLILNEYSVNPTTKEIVGGETIEIIRGDPSVFELIMDYTGRRGYQLNGEQQIRVCPEHRRIPQTDEYCKECSTKTYPAWFKTTYGKQSMYYMENEVIHIRKYYNNMAMGYSNIFAIYDKVKSLMALDTRIRNTYEQGRPPSGILIWNNTWDQVKKIWDQITLIIKQNPGRIPNVANPIGERSGKKLAEYINLMGSSKDEEFVEHRRDMRRMISALYGVTPIFSGDLDTAGGLNNEGQQVIITNKAVERGQTVINQKILHPLSRLFGVDHYTLTLIPNTEKDEMKDLEIKGKEIENAERMLNMGFDVKLAEDGQFEFGGDARKMDLSANPFFSPQQPNQITDRANIMSETKDIEKSKKKRQRKSKKQ